MQEEANYWEVVLAMKKDGFVEECFKADCKNAKKYTSSLVWILDNKLLGNTI